MRSRLQGFEAIARALVRGMPGRASALSPILAETHPFEIRNVHPGLPAKVRDLFDDGYYAEATWRLLSTSIRS